MQPQHDRDPTGEEAQQATGRVSLAVIETMATVATTYYLVRKRKAKVVVSQPNHQTASQDRAWARKMFNQKRKTDPQVRTHLKRFSAAYKRAQSQHGTGEQYLNNIIVQAKRQNALASSGKSITQSIRRPRRAR